MSYRAFGTGDLMRMSGYLPNRLNQKQTSYHAQITFMEYQLGRCSQRCVSFVNISSFCVHYVNEMPPALSDTVSIVITCSTFRRKRLHYLDIYGSPYCEYLQLVSREVRK